MAETGFKIKSDQFEGPIDLLLQLIEDRKLHINDISLARVADDYIANVQNMSALPVADTASFILVASILVLIKSLSLLPNLAITEEEKQSIEELEKRLEIYRDIKRKSEFVRKQFGANILFAREERSARLVVFSPAKDMTLPMLISSIQELLKQLPKTEKLPEAMVEKVVSIEEMMNRLSDRIRHSMILRFSEFSGGEKTSKISLVVSFLAMLELVKQGAILVRQSEQFQEIEMHTDTVNIPNY